LCGGGVVLVNIDQTSSPHLQPQQNLETPPSFREREMNKKNGDKERVNEQNFMPRIWLPRAAQPFF
jgi:hypothetical protein